MIQVSIKGQLSTPQNNFILEYNTTIKNTGEYMNVLIQKRYREIKREKKNTVYQSMHIVQSFLCCVFSF